MKKNEILMILLPVCIISCCILAFTKSTTSFEDQTNFKEVNTNPVCELFSSSNFREPTDLFHYELSENDSHRVMELLKEHSYARRIGEKNRIHPGTGFTLKISSLENEYLIHGAYSYYIHPSKGIFLAFDLKDGWKTIMFRNQLLSEYLIQNFLNRHFTAENHSIDSTQLSEETTI